MKGEKTKKRRFLLATGYPWYTTAKDTSGACPYTHLTLMDGPNRTEGRKRVEIKPKWGAWQKVKIWIEKV